MMRLLVEARYPDLILVIAYHITHFLIALNFLQLVILFFLLKFVLKNCFSNFLKCKLLL